MVLFSTFWRIFLFHSTNSSIVTLEFIEIIHSMLESKPISIFLLDLFWFIDIASRKLGPLLTSFPNLEFVDILSHLLKHGHDSDQQNLYGDDNHILLCLFRM